MTFEKATKYVTDKILKIRDLEVINNEARWVCADVNTAANNYTAKYWGTTPKNRAVICRVMDIYADELKHLKTLPVEVVEMMY